MTAASEAVKHPAKYSKEIMPVLTEILRMESSRPDTPPAPIVLDPFAGTGRIHDVADLAGWGSTGVEIEPEWAAMHPATVLGNALRLPWADGHFDAIATSPTYGNRFADKHKAKDGSVRRSYTHDIGHDLHPYNSGGMQWGSAYRSFHRRAWVESVRVLRSGGLFVLNISDHIRGGLRKPVTGFHVRTLCSLGLDVEDIEIVSTRRLRYGANTERPLAEYVITFRKSWW